ncbi:efflux transporter, RND family, MFP subunit [Thioalkalivibrio sp. K90mix]|uniref:efflux RND transporter periplasmic adaptor subunit n=1 Tax=Thioalkalivibrio sp. (strain K90mix) TaxID=396595 RepID=UPI000195A87F|nr:efflux RND transporter periplasmic adaptor subunit [Thioalkalivibrio sp. K90mix]ADC71020.1 efflux transporter, RND family, MFP subunit [Thioalkalivibrio sp. K90mix]
MTLKWMRPALWGLLLLPFSAQADFPFETATAERQTLAQERILDGRVEAVQRSTISAQTSGRIREIYVDVDDFVEADELLLRVSDSEQQARVSQAEGDLAEARARFNEARSEFNRIQDVFDRGVVSRSEFERAEAELQSARARLRSAEGRVEEAREQLGYTEVFAPYSGIVTERHVEVGESVSPGSPLLSGISLDRLRVEVDVPQRLIHAVRERREAEVLLNDDRRLAAESLTIFPYADPASSTFRIRVNLPEQEDLGLFPGMFVKTAFFLNEVERLTVPREAVVYRSEVTAVYVIDDEDRVRFRQVRVGRTYDGYIEILGGLGEGERVALDPVHAAIYLKEHQQVGADE